MAASQQSVFVYGTLMYKPVLETLLKRVPPHCKAEAKGFRRYAITTQVFPGTIEATDDCSVRDDFPTSQRSLAPEFSLPGLFYAI